MTFSTNHARLACAALALGLVSALQFAAMLMSPQRFVPAAITVKLAPGESLALGRAELAAPRAGARQFVVNRDAGGRWWLQNVNPAQSAVLRTGDERRRTGSVGLAAGQQLQVGVATFTVSSAGGGRIALRGASHTWNYDGALLRRDGLVLPACPDAGAAARLATYWNRIAPAPLTLSRPLAFGGHLHCGNRLAVAGLDNGQAMLARDAQGGIALQVRGSQPVLVQENGQWRDAAQRAHALEGVASLATGRSSYAVSIDGGILRLQPAAQVELFAEPKAELPAGLAWTWTERSLWQFDAPSGAALATALMTALLLGLAGTRLAGRTRGATAFAKIAAAVAIAALAALVLVMQRGGGAPGAGWPLLLGMAALWHALLWPRRVPLIGAVAVLLLGAGLLVQLELGLGARDTSWLRHVETSCVLLALGLPSGLLLLQGVGRRELSRPATEWLLVGLSVLALAGLLLQVAFGNETGVFEVQPVEFAKLALAALSAHCLALATGGAAPVRRSMRTWLRMLAPMLLFVLLLGVALVQVDDFSPLILLMVWAAATGLAWCFASGRRRMGVLLAALCCAVLAGALGLQQAGQGLGAAGFYTERFQVWADPAAHPHTGQQMLLGSRAVADGGWLGSDGLLGVATLGQAAGEALRIPAVQDDFAPSFLLNRHGLLGGLLLWALQALLLGALLHAALAAWRAGAAAGEFRRAWLGRFQCFLLLGGAAFLAGHFLLSWGTNLALFPIMGQPMSFLSAGGSHLLFFICPLLAFGMASVQSFQES